MKLKILILTVAVAAILTAPASAIEFFNINIEGDLSGDATWEIGGNCIDFFTPNAGVGDPFDPKRFGELVITFEATSDVGMVSDYLTISILGGLSGSGIVFFNEVIEDLDTNTIIGTDNAVLDENSELPYTKTILFDHAATHVKVKKSFILSAEDTEAFDLAKISLVEQCINEIPEPATLSLLGLAAVPFLRRRK